eukprot:2806344-Alexandrium_andersonii.AAC.1
MRGVVGLGSRDHVRGFQCTALQDEHAGLGFEGDDCRSEISRLSKSTAGGQHHTGQRRLRWMPVEREPAGAQPALPGDVDIQRGIV